MDKTQSFAVCNKDERIRKLSSSGGAFYSIAKYVLDEDGIVFGASFDDAWQVKHTSCESIDGLTDLMQSKYAQSSMGDVYKQIRKELSKKRMVLFCGTPCQVNGLLSFLGSYSDYSKWKERLFTIDFICHGVPSRMVWRRYLKKITKGKVVTGISFRDKTYGWRDYSLRIDYTDGTNYTESWRRNIFLQGFIKNLYLRESCYACQFRRIDRVSDFTIADFWGVHELIPEFFDDLGTSIVMLHNEKAMDLFKMLSRQLNCHGIDNETIVKTNVSIVMSPKWNNKRSLFFEKSNNSEIDRAIESCIRITWVERAAKKLKRSIIKEK